MQNNYDSESRRGSRSRALERSLSYSEAIGNGRTSGRNSIEIPRMVSTDVYANEELKKQYRISQAYVEGKEISFPYSITNIEANTPVIPSSDGLYSSEDDGLVMKMGIDEDDVADIAATEDDYDKIEMMDFDNATDVPTTQAYGYSTPFSRRKKKGSSHRRRHGRPVRSRRVVLKDGEENVPVRSHISAKSIKYMRDIVNTVINSKWRFIILLMVLSHILFWFVVAGVWYGVLTSYADDIGDGKTHCVTGTSSFAGLLMMAVETHMTIGYGTRYPSEECPEAIIIMVFEIVAGTALSGGLAGLLFTKLVRPNRHVTSVGFSKKAAICLRDGQLCLQFRVWDLLSVHLIGTNITAYMLKPIRTLEGELVKNYIHQLELKEARAFLLWPITVVHVIDAQSPLYDLSAQDCMDYRFEIVVCLQGSSKNMGTVTQSRTSYLSKEIMWGYRFKNVLKYSKKHEAYEIEDEHLNSVEAVATPLCSAGALRCFELDAGLRAASPPASTPTNLSLGVEDMSSLPSSHSFSRGGTQRSFGWNFRRENTEINVEDK